jgi:DNA-binding MarR family transcriptional regulator/N-acetylglutamate synthase-like GNAT family acetyltransferase
MVGRVRRFNGTLMQRVGAIEDQFFARHRPLAEARLLWEIGHDGAEVRSLRMRLGLDSGRTSHILRALKGDGMVEVTGGGIDRRVRTARLTPAGLAEREEIERAADALARSFLEPLTPRQQKRLVDAMNEVEHLLTVAMVEFRKVDPAHPDARQCLRAYVAELNRRSESRYDPAAGVSAEPHELRPPAGAFIVAYLSNEPVGCGAVKHRPNSPSEIKRMWIADNVRGMGLGTRLLEHLEAEARRSGAGVARLETNAGLTEAIALYRAAGYREVPPFNEEPFAHHWFEKVLR